MNKFLCSILSVLLIPAFASASFNLTEKTTQLIQSSEMQKSLAAGSRDKWISYLSSFASGDKDSLISLSRELTKTDLDKDAFAAVSAFISESMGDSFYGSLGLKDELDELLSMQNRFNMEDQVVLQKAEYLQRSVLDRFSKLPQDEAKAVKQQAEADILNAVQLLIKLLQEQA